MEIYITKSLYKDFLKVLKKIDILYIYDIYTAGEKPIKNINSLNLVKDLQKDKSNVYHLSKKHNLQKILLPYFSDENLIIFMGAGSITYFANNLVKDYNAQ